MSPTMMIQWIKSLFKKKPQQKEETLQQFCDRLLVDYTQKFVCTGDPLHDEITYVFVSLKAEIAPIRIRRILEDARVKIKTGCGQEALVAHLMSSHNLNDEQAGKVANYVITTAKKKECNAG